MGNTDALRQKQLLPNEVSQLASLARVPFITPAPAGFLPLPSPLLWYLVQQDARTYAVTARRSPVSPEPVVHPPFASQHAPFLPPRLPLRPPARAHGHHGPCILLCTPHDLGSRIPPSNDTLARPVSRVGPVAAQEQSHSASPVQHRHADKCEPSAMAPARPGPASHTPTAARSSQSVDSGLQGLWDVLDESWDEGNRALVFLHHTHHTGDSLCIS